MSKERELLKECRLMLDNPINGTAGRNLQIRITELLAQPEQEKYTKGYAEAMRQQVYEAFEAGRKSATSEAWNKEREDVMSEAWGLTQPEQEPVGIVRTIGGYPDQSEHTVELTCKHGDLKDGDLLYTAPTKREPLSDEAVCEILLKKEWKGFVDLVRIIEKAHGITGVDDE